ncbi:MAG: ribonuclease P protein component [Verrucomicrobiales bacterium]|jgi:ribonuclease P protein component
MKLPRPMRLRSRSDFQRSRKEGKSYAGRFLVVSVLRDPEALPLRFGIILTKKVGNAVARNHVRRRIRALLSEYGERMVPGYRLVIIGRYTAPSASFEALEKDWLKQLQRAKILQAG